MNDGRHQMPEPAAPAQAPAQAQGQAPAQAQGQAPAQAPELAAGSALGPESAGGSASDASVSLPVMPGFREMALRRSADAQAAQAAQAARMAGERGRLVRELAEQ